MSGLYIFLVVLILIVCVLLALVVLVQNSKGGGLAANFSAPNQIMGVRKTTDFLEKATWGLAIALMVLSLAATATIHAGQKSNVETTEVTATEPVAAPMSQTAAPVASEAAPAEAPAN